MKKGVKLALLLKKGVARLPAACEKELSRLGVEITTVGAKSVSARMSKEDFEAVFGAKVERVVAKAPGRFDKGAPSGYRFDGELDVPGGVSRSVDRIDVVPPAIRLK